MLQKESKYKKIAVTMLSIIAIIVCYICLNNQKDNFIINIYKMYKSDVDSGIAYLMNSEEFKSMTDDKKADCMKHLLEQYQSSREIKNVYYDANTKIYTFEYKNGVLGGVMLEDFDPNLNMGIILVERVTRL